MKPTILKVTPSQAKVLAGAKAKEIFVAKNSHLNFKAPTQKPRRSDMWSERLESGNYAAYAVTASQRYVNKTKSLIPALAVRFGTYKVDNHGKIKFVN
jgi:hypothetical protein